MKSCSLILVSALALFSHAAEATQVSPIEKIVQMLSDLRTKVIGEGTEAQRVYDEYSEWCEDRSKNLGFEIKTGQDDVAALTATIQQETSRIAELETKIEALSNDIQTDESDLAAATTIREQEAADFAAEEKETSEVISMLERATSILSKEMAKGGAAMLQVKSATSITQALSVMVSGSLLSSADASRLTALVQSSSDDQDSAMGAPAAAVYEGHSDGIVGTLEMLTDKATAQLESARKSESTSLQNYQMLKQSLTDEVKYANKDMDKARKGLAASTEHRAQAEGGLAVTSKALSDDVDTKSSLHQDCMTAAEEFELATKSRGEELSALATAQKVIVEATAGAASQSYSFLQLDRTRLASSADLVKAEALRFIRDLARKSKSQALAQLASRMSSAMRLGSAAGEDPFSKVKTLITDMLATLEADAEKDLSMKSYCDKELSEANAKKADLSAQNDKLSTKIAQDTAASAKLKEQVATLSGELAGMAKAKAEADNLRVEEKSAYNKNSAEMEMGIEGVKTALQVLRDYYAKTDKSHGSADGAGSSIIGLLEVCESDFTKGLTEMTAEEQRAAADYEGYSKLDQIDRAAKEQDVKYKNREAAGLDKAVSQVQTDLSAVNDELSAVISGLDKLREMCVAKAEPYAERAARRKSEIDGLKEALEILESEAAFMQTNSKHALRGVHAHRT